MCCCQKLILSSYAQIHLLCHSIRPRRRTRPRSTLSENHRYRPIIVAEKPQSSVLGQVLRNSLPAGGVRSARRILPSSDSPDRRATSTHNVADGGDNEHPAPNRLGGRARRVVRWRRIYFGGHASSYPARRRRRVTPSSASMPITARTIEPGSGTCPNVISLKVVICPASV